MKYLDLAADFVAPSDTWRRGIARLLVFMLLIFLVLAISDFTGLKSIVFMFGYAWGGLSVYGFMRKKK